MKRLVLLACMIAAGCSDSASAPCADAAVCGGACPAVFTGNFAESSASAASCANVQAGTGSAASDQLLGFSVISTTLANPITISIDLGSSPEPGVKSSETVATWSALAATAMGDGGCVYSAGSEAVPTGSFMLTLGSVDGTTAHGQLELLAYVHALVNTNCGAGDTETIDVTF